MNVIYINDEILDINPSQTIAITLQKIAIGDISSRHINRSNIIKAPNTENNNRLFGNANVLSSATSIPYNFQDCRLVQKGIVTISNGKCQIVSSGDEYSFVIYEDFISISAFLEGKTLRDLTWPAQAWNNAGIDAVRAATSGWLSGVMGWGYSTVNIYTADRFLPCYYYHSLITTILGLTGYTLSGAILSDSDFTDLVCTPVTKFTYTEENEKYNTKESTSSSSVSGSFSTNGATTTILTPVLEYGYNPAITLLYMDIEVSMYWNSLTTSFGGGSTSTFQIRIIGSIQGVIDTYNYTSGGTAYTVTFTKTNVLVGIGETISIQARFNKDGAFPADSVSYDYGVGTFWRYTWDTVVDRALPSWVNLVNTTSLKDIIKDFFVRFGIIHKVEDNTLYLKTFEAIATDTSGAVDWSAKRVRDTDSINFRNNYSQTNNFVYAGENETLGSGLFDIDSDVIPGSQTILNSVFNSALKWEGSGYEVMNIPAYDSGSSAIGDLVTDVPLTLGTVKARTTEAAITFNVSSRTDYKLIYFLDSNQPKDCSFQYFVNNYYTTLSESLQMNKVITRFYNLTEVDISAYDPHKMIWDDGYFIVNKISNYISGKLTSVELFKIG